MKVDKQEIKLKKREKVEWIIEDTGMLKIFDVFVITMSKTLIKNFNY